MERFSELYDQLSAYEEIPNTVHYVTRFMEGLVPHIRLLVGIQQPTDLDTTYTLAVLSEELGDTSQSKPGAVYIPVSKRSFTSTMKAAPPRISEDKRVPEPTRAAVTEDRWSALRAYRKSKGLCFTCGEKWARDHQCKQEVQLHVVQEMLEYVQKLDEVEFSEDDTSESSEVNAICISAAALGELTAKSVTTMKLRVQLQGMALIFLVDSGSTHTFLDCTVAHKIQGIMDMPINMVKVANGGLVPCSQ